MGAAGRREVDAEATGGGFSLNGGEDFVRVLEDKGVDGKKKVLGLEGAGVVKKDYDLRRSMAASLMSLKIPR